MLIFKDHNREQKSYLSSLDHSYSTNLAYFDKLTQTQTLQKHLELGRRFFRQLTTVHHKRIKNTTINFGVFP